MATPNTNVRAASFRLSTVATSTRQTTKTDFGSIVRTGALRAGQVAAEGMQVAAPFVPGGAIVSAALAGANHAAGMVAGTTGSGIGTHTAALTAPGTVAGGYGGGGAFAIPGQSPGINTNIAQPAANFAPAGGVAGAGAGSTDAFNQMMAATQNMAEFNASFNLQYLQLQERIQVDTRQFNLISNIMKTKHDAAKNALNNVR